jgi:hypothetical protein
MSKADHDNHCNQCNPNNDEYWHSREDNSESNYGNYTDDTDDDYDDETINYGNYTDDTDDNYDDETINYVSDSYNKKSYEFEIKLDSLISKDLPQNIGDQQVLSQDFMLLNFNKSVKKKIEEEHNITIEFKLAPNEYSGASKSIIILKSSKKILDLKEISQEISQELNYKEEKFGHIPNLISKYSKYPFNLLIPNSKCYSDSIEGEYIFENENNIRKYFKYNNLSLIKTTNDCEIEFNDHKYRQMYKNDLKIDNKLISSISDTKIINEIKQNDLFSKLNRIFSQKDNVIYLHQNKVVEEWKNVLNKMDPFLISRVKNENIIQIINLHNDEIIKNINLPKLYRSNKIIDHALLENDNMILKLDNFELLELNLKNSIFKSFLFTPKIIPKSKPKSKEDKYDEMVSILSNDNLSNEKRITKLESIINGL